MNENEARYIIRMINAFKENMLFPDATDEDDNELDRIHDRYIDAGRWARGFETALVEFILRVDQNGVPGGRYLQGESRIKARLVQREVPLIERPEAAEQENKP